VKQEIAVFGVALLWRALLAARTPIPSEDGVNYLWSAERFALGDFASGLAEVFPPLLSLLVAPFVALGLDPFRAAQGVLCVLGALGAAATLRLGERLAPGTGPWLAPAAIAGGLPARLCAEVYTEPAFSLLGALAGLAALENRPWRLGLCAGFAFWLRPEAALFVLGFLVPYPRLALRAAIPFSGSVLALASCRAACGHGFDPLPKLPILLEKSFSLDVLGLATAWLEAFGPLGACALALLWPRPQRSPLSKVACSLAWMLVLMALVLLLYVPRKRFLGAWGFAVLPLAALWLRTLPWPRVAAALWLAAIAHGALTGWRTTDLDRVAEQEVGLWLRGQLAAHETVTGDMTRVVYFAGRRPLPPRHFSAAELIANARAQGVRFVVLGSRRATTTEVVSGLAPEFAVEKVVEERGITVLRRR
jgi:hypothetical protein